MLIQNQNLEKNVAYTLIDEKALQARTLEMAAEIDADYADKNDLLLVCVLRGAYIFLGDLCRAMKRPHEVDFMAISSYGAGIESSGNVRIMMDLRQDIAGRHVLIVEDIVDSGHTLDYLCRLLQTRHPASIRVCSLLNKPERREVNVDVDIIGFNIPNEFVVGYGLDFDEVYRNLPYIAVLKPEVFAHLFAEP